MKVTADALRELHRIHRQLSDLRGRLSQGPKQIAVRETTVARLADELKQAKDTVTKNRMAADQRELQLREREARIQDVKIKLNTCKTNREFQAFKEQIAADEQANSVLADEILELLDKIAADQNKVVRAEENVAAGTADLEKLRKRVSDERQSLEVDLARLTTDLQTAESALPAEFRGEYQRIAKSRGEEALAPVDGDCCGGCYQQITSQMINELQMSLIVFCKSCGRILYLSEDRSAS
jgi:hypothetical protein